LIIYVITVLPDLAVFHFRVQVAEVLPRTPHIIEAMLEFIAQHLLGTLELLDIRITFKKTTREPPSVALLQGTRRGKAAVITTIGVVLQIGIKIEIGIFAEVQREA